MFLASTLATAASGSDPHFWSKAEFYTSIAALLIIIIAFFDSRAKDRAMKSLTEALRADADRYSSLADNVTDKLDGVTQRLDNRLGETTKQLTDQLARNADAINSLQRDIIGILSERARTVIDLPREERAD